MRDELEDIALGASPVDFLVGSRRPHPLVSSFRSAAARCPHPEIDGSNWQYPRLTGLWTEHQSFELEVQYLSPKANVGTINIQMGQISAQQSADWVIERASAFLRHRDRVNLMLKEIKLRSYIYGDVPMCRFDCVNATFKPDAISGGQRKLVLQLVSLSQVPLCHDGVRRR